MTIVTGLDIESTGLLIGANEKAHRIIEINCQMFDLETRERKINWTQRINPLRSIDPKAEAVHGISAAELVACPTWEVVGPKVAQILAKTDIAVAHNGDDFDFPFIVYELLRIKQPVPKFGTFDTMVNGRWATPDGKVPNLGELAYACDVEYDPAKGHAADYDVDVMMQALWRGIDLGHFDINSILKARAAA